MSRFVSRRHSPVAALAERRDRCKAEPQDRVRFSADAEANVADGFGAEALFQFSHDFSLANFFELVMHGDWRDTHIRGTRTVRTQRRGGSKNTQFGESCERMPNIVSEIVGLVHFQQ